MDESLRRPAAQPGWSPQARRLCTTPAVQLWSPGGGVLFLMQVNNARSILQPLKRTGVSWQVNDACLGCCYYR